MKCTLSRLSCSCAHYHYLVEHLGSSRSNLTPTHAATRIVATGMATVRELLAEITSLNALFNGRSDEQVSRLGAVQATSLIAKIGSLRAAPTEDAFRLDDAITATDARFDTASLSNALAERLERINAHALKTSARNNASTQLGVKIPRVHERLS